MFWWYCARCDGRVRRRARHVRDGEGRECRRVSTGKEMKQNAENFKRDILLCAAKHGGRPGAGAGCRLTREKSVANGRRKGQEVAHRRPQVRESGEKRKKGHRAGASNIVTLDRRESCEEAAVPKIIQGGRFAAWRSSDHSPDRQFQ